MQGRATLKRTVGLVSGIWVAAALAPAAAFGQSADLSLTKSDSADPVQVGSEFDYEIAAANAGPDGATGVAVVDTLPNEVEFVSASTTQGTCAQQGSKRVECAIGSLASGASASVTIRVRAARAGEAVNTATVSGTSTDPNGANDEATARTAIQSPGGGSCAGLAVTIPGTSGADTLTGTEKRDVIAGLGGNDTIRGLDGRDVICGGRGVDTVRGGGDGDLVKGGADADLIRGNGGDDALRGNSGDDVLRGGRGDDALSGGAGTDACAGGRGKDTRRNCE